MTFKDLNLQPAILKAIAELGYNNPTPIQEAAIPKILEGFDLQASAQTGTGKTAAFLLPALNRLAVSSPMPGHGPRVLVIVPTRELAMQVANEAIKYSKYLPKIKTVCLYGGASYIIQNKELARPYEILVATPGRLIDHIERGRIDFSRLEIFLLDEADRMLDMGFIQPVEQIASMLPESVQTLMFSATFQGNILRLAKRLLKQPIEISLNAKQGGHENIQQYLHHVDGLDHKLRLLDHILRDETLNQAIIFTATKRYADQLVNELRENGHYAAALHGDLDQRKRMQIIKQVREGKFRVLVATDVAARGIDIQTISHVINFDLPSCVEDYVHRIGRTGRADEKGIALSFAAHKDGQLVKRIEQFIGQKIVVQVIPGMEAQFKPTSRVNANRNPHSNNLKSGPLKFRQKRFSN